MPDQADPKHQPRWLSDTIVSLSQSDETSHRHDGPDLRPDRKEPFLSLQFASVYVRDQERSLRFFVDQLGFIVAIDARFASGNRFVQVMPPDGTASLALVMPTPGLDEERLIGHSAPITFVTEDVEAKYKEWSARGVKFTVPPQRPAWGGVFCRFQDVDGNPFALAGFDGLSRNIDERRRAFAARQEAERRAAQELEIAKQVQARLFPQSLPPVPTLDYAGVCIQARSVGGDYYDFLDLGSGRLALVVGDIAGKGIAAALVMANLQAALRSQYVSAIENPAHLLSSVNRLLFENTTASSYATLFFAEYDHQSGCLAYANCGHLAGLVLRHDGTLDRLPSTCTVVGLFPDWQCSMAASRLHPGDTLALYTDGATESFNADGEEFGEQRLVESIGRNCGFPAERLAGAVLSEVLAFSGREQFDDITLIVAKSTGK